MTHTPTRPFRFGAIAHPDYLQLALRLPALEDWLNGAIEPGALGAAIDRIYFSPILMPAAELASGAYPEVRRYEADDRLVWIQIPLDAAAALASTDEALARLILHRIQWDMEGLLAEAWSADLPALLPGEEE